MIRITSQDGCHQYDDDLRPITTWDAKKCCWIVNKEFEKERIDWYGKDSDFLAGTTEAEFERNNPNWASKPNISVTWRWDTAQTMQRAFGAPTISEVEWYEKTTFPHSDSRFWGYIECSENEAVERFGKYCNFHRHADNVIVRYNEKVLHDGKLS
jgi:hypothetical protein